MTSRTYIRWEVDGKPMQCRAGAILKCVGVTDDEGAKRTFFVLDMACIYYPWPKWVAEQRVADALADPLDGDQTWYGSHSQPIRKAASHDPQDIKLEF